MNRIILLLGALLLCCAPQLHAKITLPSLLGDNMVLQQQANVKFWGKAAANKKITLTPSWNGKVYKAKSDADGKWSLFVETPAAGGPYTIALSDGESLVLNNVLIGEVWLCSGQSNMEMPVKGFTGQPIDNSQATIVSANSSSNIRMFTVKRDHCLIPKDELSGGSWELNTPASVANFSAAAYFFGRQLQQTLNVPIGLVASSWSASKIEAWMDRKTLERFPEVDLSILDKKSANENFNVTPTLLYNAMIHPLKSYIFKGIIWYQGESNSLSPDLYSQLFAQWAELWRSTFSNSTLPIYYVQLAPYSSSMGKNELNLPIFRDRQFQSMREIPNVGMAFTSDIGNEFCIHPPQKQKVGERLAYWAFAKTYGINGITYTGPTYSKHKLDKGVVEVEFDGANDGLQPQNAEIIGFELVGANGIAIPAKAEVVPSTRRVKVWNDSISNPIEVRYCYRNYTEGNLSNTSSLPAAPFRVILK